MDEKPNMKIEQEFKKFAENMGKQDNQEMLMYFRAGWILAMEEALQLLQELKND